MNWKNPIRVTAFIAWEVFNGVAFLVGEWVRYGVRASQIVLAIPPTLMGARHESDVGGEDQRTSGIGTRLSDSYNNCQTGGSSCLKTLPPKSNWNNGASS